MLEPGWTSCSASAQLGTARGAVSSLELSELIAADAVWVLGFG
jgi:hypothetical protein